MKCPRCQHENPPGSNFCLGCGTHLGAACDACGNDLPAGSRFCNKCGTPVSAPAGQARFASPESYTPQHLVEKILTSKAALEGERKQVTVLFADLKGSMELLADRDPEEARKILDPVLELMMEAVHRYEGTVNQVMGDGIMALFGAPLAHEDHAVRACYAALRIQRRVNLYADEIQRGGGTPVQVRVGLNSGEVVVRSIGSDLHMDYTAVGQTTHLAARMEQMAKPGSALVTGETLKLAEGYFQVRSLGPITVRGLESAIVVYELIGLGPARSRFQASTARGLTPFVGRERELQQLAQALERTAAGHGQTGAVVGEAGVGKSRLFWEFTRSHRTHDWLVLESGSVSYGKATPYLPVIELLKAYFRIQDRDDPREIRERVAGKLLMLDRALEPLLTPLLALLDVPVADAAWDALDPAHRRQRTLEAVKRLLLRESQVQPLLVIFEDLHWIDSATQSLLDGLIESLPTARVLLLVNYRPEYQHPWGHKSYYFQLRIDPLPPESAEDLLSALLGEDRALEPLKRVLIERTEGNPFFLEESVRTLVETQMLIGERGAYRMAKAPEQWQIPATVQAILAARIDRLPPENKRLLQAASIIGKDVPFALLHAIADVSEDTLHLGLTHLQGAEFLYEASLFPDLEYTFKHALTHEVAYESVLQERRRTLHARIVEAIERLYPDRLTEHIERLAHHSFRGEVWEKAVTHLQQAGTKAFGRLANQEAVACFEQALGALAKLPENRETLERGIDLRLDLRNALLPLGEQGRTLTCLRDAERLALSLDDHQRLARVSAYMTLHFWWTGDHDRAVESAQRGLAMATEVGDFATQVTANFHLGQLYWARGEYRRAVGFLRRNVETLAGPLARERFGQVFVPSVDSRCYLAFCLAELGTFAEGITLSEEGAAIAKVAGSPFSLTTAYRGLGYVCLRQGDVHRAIPVLEQALAICQEWKIELLLVSVGYPLGCAYIAAGRLAEGRLLLGRALERAEAMGVQYFHSFLVSALGEAHMLAGQLDDAILLAERALDLSRGRKESGVEAYALGLLGKIASHRDPPDVQPAESRYGEALALADALGMRPLAAHCHAGLAKLYRRTSQRTEADEHFAAATSMYREMGMIYSLEKAEAEQKTRA